MTKENAVKHEYKNETWEATSIQVHVSPLPLALVSSHLGAAHMPRSLWSPKLPVHSMPVHCPSDRQTVLCTGGVPYAVRVQCIGVVPRTYTPSLQGSAYASGL